MPFEALFVPDALRAAVSDQAWLDGMLAAERALRRAGSRVGVVPAGDPVELDLDAGTLAEDGRGAGNPSEPLARALREHDEHAHFGATSQDIMDTAAALVAREAGALILAELDGLAVECARLAEEHRVTVMAGRTLLQQAVPTTFGLKAAGWLVGVVQARSRLAQSPLPAQLGGAAGTLAAFGERGLDAVQAYAEELDLPEPPLPWHTNRVPLAELGAALDVAAGTCTKIAVDVQLLAQTEIGEVREPAAGGSSTMPHKRNPVGSTLAGLEVDAARMRANISDETLSEARRLGIAASTPEEYLGSADALVDRALELYRQET